MFTIDLNTVKARLAAAHLQEIAALLDQDKLLSVYPSSFFLFCRHLFMRFTISGAIGALIPVSLSSSQITLALLHCSAESVWYRLPEVSSPDQLLQTIELELSNARATGNEVLLQNIDYWNKRQQEYLAQTHYARLFFLVEPMLCFISQTPV